MSVPAPAPPPPAASFSLPQRVLLAAGFAGAGFAIVWGGFGLAGFGTDVHASRATGALIPLFLCGLPVVWPGQWRVARLIAVLVGFGTAGYAWWEVRTSQFKSAMSLSEAARMRNWYRERLTIPTAEEAENSDGLRGLRALLDQYPSLCKDLSAEYERWANAVADDIVARYQALPPDDFKRADALVKPAKALAAAHPASADRLDETRRAWRTGALNARAGELNALRPGDWDGFNRTAFGRRMLSEAVPEARDALLGAEAGWVDASAELLVATALAPKGGDKPAPREYWKQVHWDVLALKSLDTSEGRFVRARERLFRAAHDGARRDALAHFEAGRYDRALGIAVTHAVDWAGAADLLGASERKELAELRANYEFLGVLASKAAPQLEVAPPPRAKP